jgi:phage gp36-like protein
MTAYATGSDLIARYDVDLIGDLATDDRETLDRDLVADSGKVATALADASGEVEVAMMAGGRYTIENLQTLAGNSANHLKQIVCGLAMAALYRRRPEAASRELIEDLTRDAREAIRSLRRGENVFGIQANIEAMIPELTGPSAIDHEDRNDLSVRMGRYFPSPASRLPRGQ